MFFGKALTDVMKVNGHTNKGGILTRQNWCPYKKGGNIELSLYHEGHSRKVVHFDPQQGRALTGSDPDGSLISGVQPSRTVTNKASVV